MNATPEPMRTSFSQRSWLPRFRRLLAAAFVAVGLTGAAVVSTAPAAHALTGDVVTCSRPWGAGQISVGLPAMPAGVTKAIYLYKAGPNNQPVYQGVMDWAKSNNNYGWQQGIYPVGYNLVVTTNGLHGFYYVWTQMWASNGATLGAWSVNGCSF